MKRGISSRHGSHQVAQKLTTSTLPFYWFRDCSLPEGSGSARARRLAPSSRGPALGVLSTKPRQTRPAVSANSPTTVKEIASRWRRVMRGRPCAESGRLLCPVPTERYAALLGLIEPRLFLGSRFDGHSRPPAS